MKPTLQLKLTPNLTLTPQLQQSIRLLQLSTHELNQEIERLAQENPLLELENSIHEQPYVGDAPSETQSSPTLSNEEGVQSEDSYLNNSELNPNGMVIKITHMLNETMMKTSGIYSNKLLNQSAYESILQRKLVSVKSMIGNEKL